MTRHTLLLLALLASACGEYISPEGVRLHFRHADDEGGTVDLPRRIGLLPDSTFTFLAPYDGRFDDATSADEDVVHVDAVDADAAVVTARGIGDAELALRLDEVDDEGGGVSREHVVATEISVRRPTSIEFHWAPAPPWFATGDVSIDYIVRHEDLPLWGANPELWRSRTLTVVDGHDDSGRYLQIEAQDGDHVLQTQVPGYQQVGIRFGDRSELDGVEIGRFGEGPDVPGGVAFVVGIALAGPYHSLGGEPLALSAGPADVCVIPVGAQGSDFVEFVGPGNCVVRGELDSGVSGELVIEVTPTADP